MNAAETTALLALATAMSFTPGPNTMLSAALAANHGLRRALRFVVAVPVGWSVMLLACALGVGALVGQWPPLRVAIQWAGVAYLLWMAWGLARSDVLLRADASAFDIGFWQGAALQFVNIKAWMLALTISAGWLGGQPASAARLAAVLGVMAAFALASNLTYALVGSALRGWLAQGRRLLWFNRALGTVLAATALWLLTF
jgi:threonine/homoserine/homoserine lactone efflux protein